MPDRKPLTFQYTEEGYCQVFYDWEGNLYCLQQETNSGTPQFTFHICTVGWQEPICEVPIKNFAFPRLEGGNQLVRDAQAFIEQHPEGVFIDA